ncbi:MAG: 23S rRNA (pseudouridine(1915)-N(3))-methyltransferase RlmH, partial [Acidobacteriota bacterium]
RLTTMGRELVVAWAHRHQRRDWEALCAEYRRRIGNEVTIRDLPVKARVASEDPGRQRAEGEALLAALPDPCWLIALDSRGKSRTTEDAARWLAERRETWPHPIAFAIGSDLGHGSELLDAARERWSLAPITFGHELARLVLYEQLYRIFSIRRGIRYHR